MMLDNEQLGFIWFMEQMEKEQQEKEKQDARPPLNDENED